MANVEEMRRRLRRETEEGLRERLAASEKLVQELVDALFAELREKYHRTILTEDDIWAMIESEHGKPRHEFPDTYLHLTLAENRPREWAFPASTLMRCRREHPISCHH